MPVTTTTGRCCRLQNQLVFVRIRSKHEEIMIAPDADYLVIATQDMRKLEKDSA
jgi:hypothetical protein